MSHDCFSPAWAEWYCQLGISQSQINHEFMKAISETRVALCTFRGLISKNVDDLSGRVGKIEAGLNAAEKQIKQNEDKIGQLISTIKDTVADIQQFKNEIIADNKKTNELLNKVIGEYTTLYKQVMQNSQDIIELKKVIDPALLEKVIKTWEEAREYVDVAIKKNNELIDSKIQEEAARATAVEAKMQKAIQENASTLVDNNQASIDRDNALTKAIQAEEARAKLTESGFDTKIKTEQKRATAEEAHLATLIEAEKTARSDSDYKLTTAIEKENERAVEAEGDLGLAINKVKLTLDKEVKDRKAKDTVTDKSIDELGEELRDKTKSLTDSVNNATKTANEANSRSSENEKSVKELKQNVDENTTKIDNLEKTKDKYDGRIKVLEKPLYECKAFSITKAIGFSVASFMVNIEPVTNPGYKVRKVIVTHPTLPFYYWAEWTIRENNAYSKTGTATGSVIIAEDVFDLAQMGGASMRLVLWNMSLNERYTVDIDVNRETGNTFVVIRGDFL